MSVQIGPARPRDDAVPSGRADHLYELDTPCFVRAR